MTADDTAQKLARIEALIGAGVDEIDRLTAERDRLAGAIVQMCGFLDSVPTGWMVAPAAVHAALAGQPYAELAAIDPAELDRMRPVVEAAEAWSAWWTDEPGHVPWAQMGLQGAVHAYRSTLGQDGTARPPQEAQDGPEAVGGTCTWPDPSRCPIHGQDGT